ncbi:MAG: tetratricopeptide repeat protein [Gemmatimonadota bacterium]
MPKRSTRAAISLVLAALLGWGTVAHAQEVRPLAPVLEPAEPLRPGERRDDDADGQPELIPIPDASSRAAAASRDRVRVAAILPASWTRIAERYQPVWVGITTPHGFGLHAWREYFALSAAAPALSAHPFFSPWGMLSYDGWLYDRYRDVWSTARAPELLADASGWLQRGDRLMVAGRPEEAVLAYRRVTQSAPDFPIGYFGLGAALAELGEDDEAARAFRQGIERYPVWLGLSLDWRQLYGDADRFETVLDASARRAGPEAPDSRFVAGVLHLFGDRPEQGRTLLEGMARGDGQVQLLLSQGPH